MEIANSEEPVGVLSSTKLGIRIVQTKRTDGIAEQLIGFTDQIRKAFEKIRAHANGLGTLTGNKKAKLIMEEKYLKICG